VALMLFIAWTNSYQHIWPLFGSTNQLLAALTLIAVTVWLNRLKKPVWFTIIPAVIMVITTIVSLIYKMITDYIPNGNLLLSSVAILLLILSIGVMKLSMSKLVSYKSSRHYVNPS